MIMTLKAILQESLLQTAAVVLEQDTRCLKSLYLRQEQKIRIPNEDIMFYAEKLYRNW